jgi:hypothetical protein
LGYRPGVIGAALGWTRWDTRLVLRAAIVAFLSLVLAWMVTAVTDEGGVAWGERAGRALPLAPGCAALGAWAALAPALARGETRALEALGRSPARMAAGAVLGGAAVAIVAALALGAVRMVDVRGFYPTAAKASAWTWEGVAFVDRIHGVRVDPDGAPSRMLPGTAQPSLAIPPGGRAAAALGMASAGLALPLLLAEGLLARHARAARRSGRFFRPPPSGATAAFVATAFSLILFQAAAVHRAPALLAAVPPALLLVFAVHRYRGGR